MLPPFLSIVAPPCSYTEHYPGMRRPAANVTMAHLALALAQCLLQMAPNTTFEQGINIIVAHSAAFIYVTSCLNTMKAWINRNEERKKELAKIDSLLKFSDVPAQAWVIFVTVTPTNVCLSGNNKYTIEIKPVSNGFTCESERQLPAVTRATDTNITLSSGPIDQVQHNKHHKTFPFHQYLEAISLLGWKLIRRSQTAQDARRGTRR